MKYIILAIFVTVTICNAQMDKEKFKAMVEKCKKELNLSDTEIPWGKGRPKLPTDEKGWCFMGCMDKESGVIGADNKINADALIQKMSRMQERNPAMYTKAVDAVKQCKTETDAKGSTKPCEIAKIFGTCMDEKRKAMHPN